MTLSNHKHGKLEIQANKLVSIMSQRLSNVPEWILTFLCSAPTSALLQHKSNESEH